MAWATALTYASAGASSLEVDLASAASQQLPVSPTEDEPATFLQLDYLPGSDDAHAFAQAADAAVGAPEDMTAVHTRVENNHRARAAHFWTSLLDLTFGPHCSRGRRRAPAYMQGRVACQRWVVLVYRGRCHK